jgi:hypothetical protein
MAHVRESGLAKVLLDAVLFAALSPSSTTSTECECLYLAMIGEDSPIPAFRKETQTPGATDLGAAIGEIATKRP